MSHAGLRRSLWEHAVLHRDTIFRETYLLCTNHKSYGGGIRPGRRKERVREKQGEELKVGLKEERKENRTVEFKTQVGQWD